MAYEHEPPAHRPDRQAVISALVGFIGETTAAASAYTAAGQQAEPLSRGRPFAHAFLETSFTQAVSAGANTVNDYLAQVGGIPAAWIDKENGDHIQGTILGCKEFDSKSGRWNLVFQGPTYSGLIGATPERLAEILGYDPAGTGSDSLG